MLNKIILRGHLSRDPEIKLTQKGRKIASFFLATNFSWKDEVGEWQTHTDWHQISVFRESTITWIKDVLKKGDMVYVEGKLSYHSWTDKYNQRRFTPHVMIEDWHGRIEYLRSRKNLPQEEKLESQEDEQDSKDFFPIEETLEDSSSPTKGAHVFPASNTNFQPSQPS